MRGCKTALTLQLITLILHFPDHQDAPLTLSVEDATLQAHILLPFEHQVLHRMDPLSIAAACVALLSGSTTVSTKICSLVIDANNTNKEISAL